MKLLIDTNVILDVLLKREPFYKIGAVLLKLSERKDIQEFVSASAVTDIFYIANRTIKNKVTVRELLCKLLQVVSVAVVSEDEIHKALELEWNDFEDSVQYSVALLSNMDAIVTRNMNDYEQSKIPVLTPDEVVKKYGTKIPGQRAGKHTDNNR